ncbi:MAG: hypothetical protein OXC48_05585 [Endozoicomonadaceae bacterium]|nr:hypothetical protein [Endozoicomonadaceae bacterium]
MNKKIFILMSILFLVTVKSYCKKVHNNTINFTYANSVSLKITAHTISGGQPFHHQDQDTIVASPASIGYVDAYTGKQSSVSYLQLTINAGRHGSDHPVKRLFDDMGFKKENFTVHKRPGKLNFAVIGVLTVDGTSFDDMVLAQGNKGLTNNW